MRVVAGVIALGLVAGGCRGGERPRAATCTSAAAKIAHGMIAVRSDIGTAGIDPAPAIVDLCTGDGWDTEVIRCYAAADAPRALRACSDRLTSDQRLHARDVQEELYRRASEVGSGDGSIGIAACDDYLMLAARYAQCDQVPEPVRDAFQDMVNAQRAKWELAGDDDSSREDVERECNAMVEGLQQRLDDQGC